MKPWGSFIAVLAGGLIMIVVGGINPDALAAAAYLASLCGAWRMGATRGREGGCGCGHQTGGGQVEPPE